MAMTSCLGAHSYFLFLPGRKGRGHFQRFIGIYDPAAGADIRQVDEAVLGTGLFDLYAWLHCRMDDTVFNLSCAVRRG